MKKSLLTKDYLTFVSGRLKLLSRRAAELFEAGYHVIPAANPESVMASVHPAQLVTFPYFLYG